MDEQGAWTAKAAITELITRYAALIDEGAWDELAALYTETARMSRPTAPDDFVVGRASILESFRSRPPRASRHIVANVLVTLEDAMHASATSQILLYVGRTEGGGLPVLAGAAPIIGTYHDRLVLTDAGWKFAERRGVLDFRASQ